MTVTTVYSIKCTELLRWFFIGTLETGCETARRFDHAETLKLTLSASTYLL